MVFLGGVSLTFGRMYFRDVLGHKKALLSTFAIKAVSVSKSHSFLLVYILRHLEHHHLL